MKNDLMKITVLAVVLGLVFAGGIAYAETGEGGFGGPGYGEMGPQGGPGQGEGGPQCRKGKGGPGDFFKELNLTDEQKEQLKTQRESQQEANKAVREQLKVKMQAVHEEIAKPESDQAALDALVAEVNTLKGQLFSQHIAGILGMKAILTPEQFSQMQAKFQERKGKMEQRHSKWMKHREGKTETESEQVPS